MKRRLVLIAWLGFAAIPSDDHAASAPAPAAADEIHWTVTGQSSVSIHWRGAETAVRYGPTKALRKTAPGIESTPRPFSSHGPFREARINALAENTLYWYAIGKGAPHTFRTPPRRGASGFTFHVQGDIGNQSDWSRVGVCQAMIARQRPSFVLCVGDLTYGNSAGQYAVDNHFNDVMVWSRDAAYMPAWGNHEWDVPERDDMRNYKGRFDLPNPQASPGDPRYPYCGGGEDWYWFDYGNVRFIAYPEPWRDAWRDWSERVKPVMEQAQSDGAIDFIVTFGHRPAYSSGYHAGEQELRVILGALGPKYDKYVLNFNGHSHDYERTHAQRGVVHVTAGTGGADLETNEESNCLWHGGCPPPAWSAFRAMHHVVVEVRVEQGRIDGRALCGPSGGAGSNRNDIACERGSVVDAWSIAGSREPLGVNPRDRSAGERARP